MKHDEQGGLDDPRLAGVENVSERRIPQKIRTATSTKHRNTTSDQGAEEWRAAMIDAREPPSRRPNSPAMRAISRSRGAKAVACRREAGHAVGRIVEANP